MKITSTKTSPSYSNRSATDALKFIILHYTEKKFDEALKAYLNPEIELSCHYLIHKNGTIYNLIDDKFTAWHAGVSYWQGIEKLNNNSIGIEIDNLGDEEFTEQQINSCIELCKSLQTKYNIPPQNILGHSDIAPDRKWDPGLFLDWKKLLKHNIGITFSTPNQTSNKILFSINDTGENVTQLQIALKKIGYKISVNGVFDLETNYSVRAFQSHFCPEVILERGGVKYFRNIDSIFPWDEISEAVIKSVLV